MSFKDTLPQFQMLDVSRIEPDPAHPRQSIDEAGLKGLVNSIRMKGLIHPLVVQPENADGKFRLIVGARRWRAAVLAGESAVPVLVRRCEAGEAMEIQVFENLGLGMRVALEPRDMANAIQTIADRFETREAAAEHFGRNATWLSQATAAANLSTKVSALLDSGKIASTGAAVQLEKLVQKNEGKAESLIEQIDQMPEGKKLSRKELAGVMSVAAGRRPEIQAQVATGNESVSAAPTAEQNVTAHPPWEDAPEQAPTRVRVTPDKVERVARILGLDGYNEDEILERLIDEFLATRSEGDSSP